MKRAYYQSTIDDFLKSSDEAIIGQIAMNSEFSDDLAQKAAWLEQIECLRPILAGRTGSVFFEYSIPRMGRRVDVVLLLRNTVFVLEFKTGESEVTRAAIDQVWDYGLDLKNFHEKSRDPIIAPILVVPRIARTEQPLTIHRDKLLTPIITAQTELGETLDRVLEFAAEHEAQLEDWIQGRYSPTPTIIEAAIAFYNNHKVDEILRNDAGAEHLARTVKCIEEVVDDARANHKKSICFVTGVPGAGKTLVGLNVVTANRDVKDERHGVFLSGNGPLVAVLREALVRDRVKRDKEDGKRTKKKDVEGQVKLFIQNVHHFRDEAIEDPRPPFEHVAIFDEAQRAWQREQLKNFMRRRKSTPNFNQSEPEFLISYMDRHEDWAVIVCLVGGGQEINTGEAGIAEWVSALNTRFPNWNIYISPELTDSEYAAGEALESLKERTNVTYSENLHLAVSMRSFRAEHVSKFVKQLLDLDVEAARETLKQIGDDYPIVLTRDLEEAKEWVRNRAGGTERYGIVCSSQAYRLKPLAIDVRYNVNPVHWFLNDKDDVRSSYYLEDVATEFQVQGLELDYTIVVWDADLRFDGKRWTYHSFVGDKWQKINKPERQQYLKNAYRVLLTRARQGMVIVVPDGRAEDFTRDPVFYDSSFDMLWSTISDV